MYKILLVEDDEALRFVYSKMKVWSKCGFIISDEAGNGKDAINLLEKNSYDLVLTDIRMPFVDGIELLRYINSNSIDVCTVLISSYDEFEYARQGLILGAFDYILKPAKEEVIEDVLGRAKKYLDSKKDSLSLSFIVKSAMENLNIKAEKDTLIYNICRYISDNFSKNINMTMEDIACEFNFNKDYFGKIFKQHTGVNFNHFYSAIKIEYAKYLIKTGNYKTYEISEILGYSSADYFTKVFKEITGSTPSKFKLK